MGNANDRWKFFRYLRIKWVLWIFYSVLILIYLYIAFFPPEWIVAASDYVMYITGASIVKDGKGELLYDISLQEIYQENLIEPYFRDFFLAFRVLPFVAVIFLPFAYFPLQIGFRMFAFLNIIFLGLVLFISNREFKDVTRENFWLLFSIGFFPFLVNLMLGQISLLLLTVYLLIYRYFKKEKYLLAGVLVGLLLFKVQYLLFIPFLLSLAKDKVRFIVGFLITIGVIGFINVAVSGWEWIIGYPEFIFNTEFGKYGSYSNDMFTVYGFMTSSSLIGRFGKFLPFVINSLLYLFFLYIFERKLRLLGFKISFAIAVMLTLLFGFHVLIHDLSVLMLPILIFLDDILSQKKARLESMFIVIVFLYSFPLLAVYNLGNYVALVELFVVVWIIFLKRRESLAFKGERGVRQGRRMI